jgi:hypothetical protein
MYISSPNQNQIEWRTTEYKPDTKLSIEYIRTSNGNYSGLSRSAATDLYECTISTAGTFAYISNIINELDKNYQNGKSDVLTLSGFVADEKLFGEDLNYTVPLSGIIIDWNLMTQGSWKGFGLSLTLQCLSPTFSASASLLDLSTACVQHSYKGGSMPDIKTKDTYNGISYTTFNNNHTRMCDIEVNITNAELAGLRRYIAVNRGTTFDITSIAGLTAPFGYPILGTYTVSLLELKEVSRFNLDRWIVKLSLGNNR